MLPSPFNRRLSTRRAKTVHELENGVWIEVSVRILDPAAVDPVLIAGPSLNVPRYDFGAVLGDDGYIYVIGGYSAGGVALSSVERLYTGAAGLEGDLDLDGDVDGADLGLLLASWGPCDGCSADLNLDGLVDGADLGLLLANWSG